MGIFKTSFFLVFILYSLFIIHYSAPSAQAQSPVRSFTISPPTILVPTTPGQTAEGVVKLRNETDEPVTFNVLIEDFIVTDTHGTPTILPPDTLSNKYSASSWIGISPTHFTVPAHERVELTYFMRIPPDARPGGHYAAIVYAPVSEKGVDSTGATVNSQIGTLFSVVIDGRINEKAEVSRFFANGFQEYGPVPVETQIKNMSDSHIRPIGNITLTNMLGGKSAQPLKEHNIFPEAARDYVNLFGEKWMFGRYTATFEATYGKDNLPLTATVAFWVIPWKIIIVIILFVIAAILGYMLLTKSSKGESSSGRKKDGDTPPPSQSSEQIPSSEPTV